MKVLVSIQQPVRQWQIPAEAVATLRARFPHIEFIYATSDEQRARGLVDCDAVYTWILKTDELATATRLRWVHSSAVAVETMCLPELFARGVVVSNTRGVQAVPIAEHTLAVVLALSKQLPLVLEHQRTAHWAQNDFMGERLPWLLHGRTLGLIGVGTIGSAIAARAHAFGMRVVALRRRSDQGAVAAVDQLFGPGDIGAFLQETNVLVIAAPPGQPGAIFGGKLAQIAKMRGAAGVVVDGATRDVAEIIDHDLPVWASSVTPIAGGYAKYSIVELNCPVNCGGVEVLPGDVIVADADGVIVIAPEDIEKLLPVCEQIQASEDASAKALASGKSVEATFASRTYVWDAERKDGKK